MVLYVFEKLVRNLGFFFTECCSAIRSHVMLSSVLEMYY